MHGVSFDHLVGAGEQRRGRSEAKRHAEAATRLIMTEDSYCLIRRVENSPLWNALAPRTSAFVLAVSFLLVPPSHAEESQSRVPSYIEADRTQAEETLGGALETMCSRIASPLCGNG